MTYEEIEPHLNKMVRIDLKNRKRKVCWIFIESGDLECKDAIKEVSYVNVHQGKKIINMNKSAETHHLKTFAESISIEDILNIRSSK